MKTNDIQTWLEQCRSGDATQQIEAIQRLSELGARSAVPVLVETVRSPDAVVRCAAAGALGRLGAEDAATAGAALLALLRDPEVIVRSEAADALGVLGYTPAMEPVKGLLLNDAEPLVRASAAETLGDLGDAGALPALEVALLDPDSAVRGYAANAIGLLGAPPVLPRLRARLDAEPSAEVKAELHGACYRLGATEDLDALLGLLELAPEQLAVNILNILDDLVSRSAPPTLAADAGRIRAAVTALSSRVPLLSADADHLVARLVKLDTLQ